ncbi:MAG: hypothetical protein NVV62_12820 [Terricaulis sp.]|nr:hypothetical protein [Terricaulis sp.]
MNIIAALALPFALMQSAAEVEGSRFEQCVTQIEADAPAAYETAMSWAAEGQSVNAYRCAAMALIDMERYQEGARRLESLARAISSNNNGVQAELFSQAGNAYLLARLPANARAAFSQAMAAIGNDPAQMPDLLIDRAAPTPWKPIGGAPRKISPHRWICAPMMQRRCACARRRG